MKEKTKETSPITIRVDAETKEKANEILDDLGLTLNAAVNIFLRQIVINDGIPFELSRSTKNSDSPDNS